MIKEILLSCEGGKHSLFLSRILKTKNYYLGQ